jgi:hypothetical protein
MAGVTRIDITDTMNGRGAYRFQQSRRMWDAANDLYRKIFNHLNMPLEDGVESLMVSKDQFMAGYDYALGIDVILKFSAGSEMTLQEKFLFTKYKTVTVEYMQDWRTGEQGDWFNMKCQLYFVGYDSVKSGKFTDWVLLDWPRVQMATMQNRINWSERRNQNDGARASFRYADMYSFPPDCVLLQRKKRLG